MVWVFKRARAAQSLGPMVVASAVLLTASVARAGPELAFGVGAAALPARHDRTTLDVTVVDATGTRWDWTHVTSPSLLTPGLMVRAELRWPVFTVGLDAALAFTSFASEAGKLGRTYGATVSLPLGFRVRRGPVELVALAGPSVVFGGYGFGSFARQQNQPIDFGAVRFFDDETALHLLDTSVGVMAGLEVRVPLSRAVALFFQVTGVSVLASSRAFNLAGYVDEAQSKVEWSQRPLSDPALSVRFDGQRFDRATTAFGFDGPRRVVGIDGRAL